MRDLISHHYLDIQADEVYDVCKNKLDELNEKIKTIRELINNETK